MIEGSGSESGSIPLTNGSGSRRPKNMWIRIRIRNTVYNDYKKAILGTSIILIKWCIPPSTGGYDRSSVPYPNILPPRSGSGSYNSMPRHHDTVLWPNWPGTPTYLIPLWIYKYWKVHLRLRTRNYPDLVSIQFTEPGYESNPPWKWQCMNAAAMCATLLLCFLLSVDESRIKEVGIDRAAAEWILR